MILIGNPFALFSDNNGELLESGYVYIGEAGLNPVTNPINVFWDKDLLYPAAQPIRTINGLPSRNGSASALYTMSTEYSVLVEDKNQVFIYSTSYYPSDVIPADGSITGSMIAAGAPFVFPTILNLGKGLNIAPVAGVLTLGADGNYFDVTGTDPITSIASVGVGTQAILHFDGILVFTDDGDNIVLQGGANITTAAGDHAYIVEYEVGKWRSVGYFEIASLPLLAGSNNSFTGDNTFSGNNTHTGEESFTGGIDTTIRDQSRGLVVKTNVVTPASQIDIDAEEIILQNTSGLSRRFTSINLTVDITASGANGLDTGSEAVDTWYYTWVIAKADGTKAGLLSVSSTAPTMPSGYTFMALVGAARNDSGEDFIPFRQEARSVRFDAVQTVKDGSFTAAAWTAQSITSFAPTTAKAVHLVGGTEVGASMGVSPRSDGHAGSYFRAASTGGTNINMGGVFPTIRSNFNDLSIRYEDTIYYFVDNAAATLVMNGWEY